MEVILLEKVTNLGDLGDRVTVRPGYGRNFLIPSRKAEPATKENIAKFEARRAKLESAASDVLSTAQARAAQLAGLDKVSIASHAGEEGKLFGSVGASDIVKALAEAGVEVEKREVNLPEGPIHNVGEYSIEIQIHSDVNQVVTIEVVAATE